jgi:hypothetical protein
VLELRLGKEDRAVDTERIDLERLGDDGPKPPARLTGLS